MKPTFQFIMIPKQLYIVLCKSGKISRSVLHDSYKYQSKEQALAFQQLDIAVGVDGIPTKTPHNQLILKVNVDNLTVEICEPTVVLTCTGDSRLNETVDANMAAIAESIVKHVSDFIRETSEQTDVYQYRKLTISRTYNW